MSVETLQTLRVAGRDVRDETFTVRARCHDWRNHVPDDLRDLWPDLSDEARGAVWAMAEELADAEEWK